MLTVSPVQPPSLALSLNVKCLWAQSLVRPSLLEDFVDDLFQPFGFIFHLCADNVQVYVSRPTCAPGCRLTAPYLEV